MMVSNISEWLIWFGWDSLAAKLGSPIVDQWAFWIGVIILATSLIGIFKPATPARPTGRLPGGGDISTR